MITLSRRTLWPFWPGCCRVCPRLA